MKHKLGIWRFLPSIKLLMDAIKTDFMSSDEYKKPTSTISFSDIDFTNEQVGKLNKQLEDIIEAVMDWYSTFSSRFISIVFGVMIAVFAYCWYNLLEQKNVSSNQILLWIALVISFVYIGNEIIRLFIIAQSMRNINKKIQTKVNKYNKCKEKSSFEEIRTYINQIYDIRQEFHDITWYCVEFQLILFMLTIIDMGIYLVVSYFVRM